MRFYISIFKAIGGAFALLIIGVLSFTSCDGAPKWVKECERGGVYKEHDFHFSSIRPDYEGYYTNECRNCGLECKFIDDMEYKEHYGAVHLYKSPNSGKFEVYIVQYQDEEGMHYKRVYKSDLKKVKR